MTVILPEMHLFTKDYYEDGIRKHISGYEEYKWMPTRSIPEALDIIDKFDFKTCVDYGCAKGFAARGFLRRFQKCRRNYVGPQR